MQSPPLVKTIQLFVALAVPQSMQETLQRALKSYERVLEGRIPPERWHVTFLWLGAVVPETTEKWQAPDQALSQSYVPILRITHLGQGKKKDQLWAYIQPTPQLTSLRSALAGHFGKTIPPTESFTPHITLGTLNTESQRFGPPHTQIGHSYVFSYVTLYESDLSGPEPVYIPKTRIALSVA